MTGMIERAIGRGASARRISFNAINASSIPESMLSDIIRNAEREAEEEFPSLPLSLYREYSISGNRTDYENLYFQKRKMLSDLVIAEMAEGKSRFMGKIEEGIWSVISEPSWTIPAHNTYIRDREALDTPLIERPVLDLFQCETGEILSLALSILKERINTILAADVEHVIRERILKPYITDHFWWMGNDGPLNNWAPWCTQNVLLSVLTLPLTEKESGKVLRTAVATLDQYIDAYPEDGSCDEGAHYYHEAALALWGCLHTLSLSVGDDIKKVFSNPKIKAMAEYIESVHIADDTYLNFADCSPKAGHLTAREYLFGKAVGSKSLMHHAALDAAADWIESDNNYNLFYKYIALSSAAEIEEEASSSGYFPQAGFTSFRSTGMAIYRENGIVFAFKGGSNGESHNHNDVGSLILYKNGQPCLIDIGVETYTKTTFSKDRYTLLPMRSSYHNVVNFPPLEQHDGEEYRAETLRMDDGGASFDLTHAYESGKGLKRYIRSAVFDRSGSRITIMEDFEADMSGVLSLISMEKPEIDECCLLWKSFRIDFPEHYECLIETIPITDSRLRRAWPDELYRTLVTLPHATEWIIRFKEGDHHEN